MKHPIDLGAAAVLRFGPDHLRFFSDGWGDEEGLTPPDPGQFRYDPLPITWLTHGAAHGHRVSHGTFTSPVDGLPPRARQGSVVRVLPSDTPERMVVLMPAWNEHEPRVRVALASRLADGGIGSIILESAYFGSRHPHPEAGHPITTVSDFMVMGRSAVLEAGGILAWLRNDHHDVGVAGYSMGANTAALVAATVPFPVAVAALAASHSPAPVFLDGVLRNGISWEALGGEGMADRLRHVLSGVSVLRIAPAPHLSSAVIIGARSDAYIPRVATQQLADHWVGSQLRWEPGGHATLVWFRKNRLASAVIDAFERVKPS
jgi:dienelactone hydrolase